MHIKYYFSLLLLFLFPTNIFALEPQILVASAVREATTCNITSTTYLAFEVRQLSGDHTNNRPGNSDNCTSSASSGLILPPGTLDLCSFSFRMDSGTASFTLTIMEDGVASAVTCTTSSGSEGGCSDTTHSISITSGKKYTSRIVRASGTGTTAQSLVVNCRNVLSP